MGKNFLVNLLTKNMLASIEKLAILDLTERHSA
jgi:hypothetical protein